MTPSQNLAMDLIEISCRIRFLARRVKNNGNASDSYFDLFKSFADTVDQVAKEVAGG